MIEIKDNGEKLVDIQKLCPEIVVDLSPKRKAYFRKKVAEMICKAKSLLPKGMTFIIGDAWRSKEIQIKVHQRFRRKFKIEHPDWSDERIKLEIGKYTAPFEGPEVSGHMTGGAVDLRLFKDGRKVPMKSRKLTYQENAKSNQPKLPKNVLKNRKIMFMALTKVGLSNYYQEYWHWSYGDIWWAKRNKKKEAFYGPINISS